MVGNWTTTFLKSVNISVENSLYFLSCQVAAIAIVRLILSRLLSKISTRIVMYVSFALIIAGAIFLATISSFLIALLAMLCLGAGFAAGFPVILGYVGELYTRMTGTAFSIVIVLALAGNTLLNYLVGVISKVWGINKFPVVLAFCVVLMMLLYSIVAKRISKKIKV
jgi:fucose permease